MFDQTLMKQVVGTDILLANRQVSNINILPLPAICVENLILKFVYLKDKTKTLNDCREVMIKDASLFKNL